MTKLSIVLTVLAAALSFPTLANAENEAVSQLKQRLTSEIDANGEASAQVKTFVKETLLSHCTDAAFVAAVQAQNAKGQTLDAIKSVDTAWAEAEEELPIHKDLMNNACAAKIREIATANPAVAEAFVMDNQGANVGQNALTSDYWQGDEPKWQNSFKNGQGGVDVGKNLLDKSSNRTMQQVSLPIFDDDGHVIGAVTYGLVTDVL